MFFIHVKSGLKYRERQLLYEKLCNQNDITWPLWILVYCSMHQHTIWPIDHKWPLTPLKGVGLSTLQHYMIHLQLPRPTCKFTPRDNHFKEVPQFHHWPLPKQQDYCIWPWSTYNMPGLSLCPFPLYWNITFYLPWWPKMTLIYTTSIHILYPTCHINQKITGEVWDTSQNFPYYLIQATHHTSKFRKSFTHQHEQKNTILPVKLISIM